jgi:RNA polymerase sigma-70 factor (ECF subfamily)
LKAWNALDSFRGESQIHTWLYRIASNETLTFLAAQRMRNVSSSLEMEEVLLSNLQSDVYFSGNDAEKKLQEAILSLPEKQRMVFNMKYFEDIKYEDMEKILNTSVGALKASYHHAVKKIKNFLNDN